MGRIDSSRSTFVVAVNNQNILRQNLLASPDLLAPHKHQILVQENYSSAACAYNAGLRDALNDLVIFVHQDVYLTAGWLSRVEEGLRCLEATDPGWGVAGCWGARATGELCGHIYSSGLGVLGNQFQAPKRVQTLDEIVLIFKKSTGLTFDNTLPHFHFYGTDVCLRAQSQGRASYVIPAFCVHNTRQLVTLPQEFYECYRHVKKMWKDYMPIQTSCISITCFDAAVHRRRLKDFVRAQLSRTQTPAERVDDPRLIVKELEFERVFDRNHVAQEL
jgi:hypothetical protein